MSSPMGSPLELELKCPVCRDLLQDPHLLPCEHSLCLDCVQDLRAKAPGGRFRCPECREEHSPAAKLHKNYALASLARDVRQRGWAQVSCDACPPEDPAAAAVKTCLRCEVSLCVEHVRPHLERPAFACHLLVEPLDDLGKRRCPEHREMFRYYCLDESLYVCADCVLEGKHSEHQVKALGTMEKELKAILQSRLQKTDMKLKESERLLKEHESAERTLMDSTRADSQVERLGDSLQAQVERLVGALRDRTQRDRQQIKARLQDNHRRVVRDLHQTRAIKQYLGDLLEEKDPFLLIWVYQSEDKKILADLNAPLFGPEPVAPDKTRTLESIETEYRRFVAETLKCVEELKDDFSNGQLMLDVNTAHPLLIISKDLQSTSRVKDRLLYPGHPDRFDHWPQVLTSQAFTSGSHFWEIEVQGYWDVAVTYRSVGRKGKGGTAFGNNRQSWSLTQQDDGQLAVWHNKRRTPLGTRFSGTRLALALDYGGGTITFSEVGVVLRHLHTFRTTFTQPVHLGFGLYRAEPLSSISIVS